MIAISSCLLGENCKYDGGNNLRKELLTLENVIPICPEMLGGLGCPRNPCEIVGESVINSIGEDVTEEFKKGALLALEICQKNNVELVILKSLSPSCGCNKIYDGTFTHTITTGDGIFVKLLKENNINCIDDISYLRRGKRMNIYEEALKLHEEFKGKLEIKVKVPCESKDDLSLAYTPGVAAPCLEIEKDKENAYVYTNKGNTVGIISDGSAVLGLGNIGAQAALPVMEGKALLMKKFANLDAIPLCIKTNDVEEIIRTCKILEPNLGGINLEDISAPRCIEIERRLIEEMDIPVFHDDQHGTAIVVLATLINSIKLTGKKPEYNKVVVSGTGAAGSSIIRMIYNYGFTNIYAFDKDGLLSKKDSDTYDVYKKELLEYVNLDNMEYNNLKEAMVGADIFIGVSARNLVSKDMVRSMNEKNIVLAMANPEPEISYDDAKEANAYIVGTGRSDRPNQVNNLLAFPGLFRGALDAKATKIDEDVKIAASIAIASLIDESELTTDYVVASPLDDRVVKSVSEAVKIACIKSGNIRR